MTEQHKKIFTPVEAAEYLGVDVEILNNWRIEGKSNMLPYVNCGYKAISYKKSDLDEFKGQTIFDAIHSNNLDKVKYFITNKLFTPEDIEPKYFENSEAQHVKKIKRLSAVELAKVLNRKKIYDYLEERWRNNKRVKGGIKIEPKKA